MQTIILEPKYKKGKKPVKVKKPSRPIDGINHRLLREQAEKAKAEVVETVKEESPVTRAELEQKATELGLSYDGRTSDRKLLAKIEEALKGE